MKNTLGNLLRFGKKVIKPLVKPIILTTVMLAGSYLFGQQYHAKNPDKINIWKQSEIVNDYYSFKGSGDVTGNGSRGMDDIEAMDNGVANIQADVNLNGINGPAEGDMEDRQLLLDNINNGTALDFDWNAKNTRAERDSTLFKATAIDGILRDEIPYNNTTSPVFESKDYAGAMVVAHQGSEKQNEEDNDVPPIFDAIENNKTGLPIFYMSYRNPNTGVNHGMCITYTGDDPSNPNNKTIGTDDITDPYDYTPLEPQNSKPNVLLKFNQNYNPSVGVEFTIRTIEKWLDYDGRNYGFIGQEAGKLKVNSEGKLEFTYQNPNVIETKEQAMDKTYPTLNLTAPENNSFQNSSQTQVNINASDEHFHRLGVSFNKSDTTWTSTTSDISFYVNSQEGENEFLAIAEDKAGNQTLEKRTYTYDPNYISIEDNIAIPLKFELYQNYPNPFNSSTTISYYSQDGLVELNIFNLKGQKLETLVNGKQTQGEHKVIWNAEEYPSGIYLYQLQTLEFIMTNKMIYLK